MLPIPIKNDLIDEKQVKKEHQLPFADLLLDISLGKSNMLEDWNRLLHLNVTIDQQDFKAILKQENKHKLPSPLFNSLPELKAFFSRHLLKYVKENARENATEYLMKALHQGGLLHPVSNAAYVGIARTGSQISVSSTPAAQMREIEFTTHSNGFKVKEKVTQKSVGRMFTEEKIEADKGEAAVFVAQATIDMHIDPVSKKTKLTLLNSSMTYGNKKIEEILQPLASYIQSLSERCQVYLSHLSCCATDQLVTEKKRQVTELQGLLTAAMSEENLIENFQKRFNEIKAKLSHPRREIISLLWGTHGQAFVADIEKIMKDCLCVMKPAPGLHLINQHLRTS